MQQIGQLVAHLQACDRLADHLVDAVLLQVLGVGGQGRVQQAQHATRQVLEARAPFIQPFEVAALQRDHHQVRLLFDADQRQ